MKNSFFLLKWMTLLAIMMACDEIIEPDISNQQLTVLTPADGMTSDRLSQTFRWEPLKGGREYHLQIASPSLASPSSYFTDTTVTRESLTLMLSPGQFEWRVRGKNAGYETPWVTREFKVDSTGNLMNQEIQLLTPTSTSVTNSRTIDFSWQALPMAESYIFQLKSLDGAYDTLVILPKPSVKVRVGNVSREYQWKVTSMNSSSAKASPTFQFSTDFIPPSAPELVSPREDTVFQHSSPITLMWKRNAGDGIRDSLFIFSSDQQTYRSGYPIAVSAQTITLPMQSPFPAGTYFWGVKSVDRAGNAGPLSTKRKFLVQ
jgi:hypothetical protein